MSSAQIMAIHFLVATFFFVCHIPNVIIEHWAFVMLIRGLAPEYASHMFKRDALSSTWLSKLHEETEERSSEDHIVLFLISSNSLLLVLRVIISIRTTHTSSH